MQRTLTILTAALASLSATAQTDSTLVSHRPDGRHESTYAIVHQMVKDTHPRWAYHEGMSKRGFKRWQRGLRHAMADIMRWPANSPQQPAPQRVQVEQCDGYTMETWECYPLDGAVTTYLVMRPGGSTSKPRPAVLCIPGSGQAMTHLTRGMALDYVREGWVAVCVDNAAAGRQGDQEYRFPDDWKYDYELSSRLLLELGWNWLGYTSYLDYHILQWMKTDPSIRRDRIVVSGFSLGTEPLMVLGVMDSDIYAFVYNDFLCQTQERAVSMTALNDRGRRTFPNSIRHLIPEYWRQFNFPDVCCALAPRPIIFTEGGLDRDFNQVRSAYAAYGAPDAVTCHHHARFADPAARDVDRTTLPEGLNAQEYFEMVNVDTRGHYFKRDLILPWLHKLLDD